MKMMDISSDSSVAKTPLQTIIEPANPDSETFKTMFLNLTNNRTDTGSDRIQFSANISYSNIAGGTTGSLPLASSRALTGGEHAVRVTKWVIVNKQLPGSVLQDRAVLVEVLMWRD